MATMDQDDPGLDRSSVASTTSFNPLWADFFDQLNPLSVASFEGPVSLNSEAAITPNETTSWISAQASHPNMFSMQSMHQNSNAERGRSGPRRSQRAAAIAAQEAISASRRPDLALPTGRKKRARCAYEDEDAAPKRSTRLVEEDLTHEQPLKPPPNAKNDANYETGESQTNVPEMEKCCICMTEPERQEISILNSCEHRFCFECIAKWGERENTCPLCKCRFTKITRVHKVRKRNGVKSPPNTKVVRERNQRSDFVSGAALEAMLSSIAASSRGPFSPSGLGPQRFGRFVFAMGTGGTSRRLRNPSRSMQTRRSTVVYEDRVIESDEDSSGSGFSFPEDFNELMRHTMSLSRRRDSRSRRHPVVALDGAGFQSSSSELGSSAWVVPTPPSLYGLFQQVSAQPNQRSYAVNTNDNDAGRAAENPIEIDDSDDDDDVVEVILPSSLSSQHP